MLATNDHSVSNHIKVYQLTNQDDIKHLYQLRNKQYDQSKTANRNMISFQYFHGIQPSWFTLDELIGIKDQMSDDFTLFLNDIETLVRFSNVFEDYHNHLDEIIILTTISGD